MRNRTWIDEIKYYGFYIWWNWIIDLPREIKWSNQRAAKGYADCDTWNLDSYLAGIIVGAVSELKEYYHGTEPTKKEFEKIIKTFQLYLNMLDTARKLTKEETKEYNEGWKLFKQYFTHLWD